MSTRHCPPTPGGNGCAGGALRRRCGFTLIELLIIIGILGVLAAIAIASFGAVIGHGQAEALRVTVRNVRELIEVKAITPNEPLSPDGYPLQIEASWFQGSITPYHTWTREPMVIETVAAPENQFFPAVKVFDPANPAAVNAWYNTTNGAFCVLVGNDGTEAEHLEDFNTVNICDLASLDQITH